MEVPTPTACEWHDFAGACTQECADFTASLIDLNANTLIEDRTGCSYPEPTMWEEAHYDRVRRAVVIVEVCPHADIHDAMPCEVCSFQGE